MRIKLLIAAIAAAIGVGTVITVAKTRVPAVATEPLPMGMTCAMGLPVSRHADCELIFN
jgi:hypothetical protein